MSMKKYIEFQPASISVKPSCDKYYGVFNKGYEYGVGSDRAFIAALGGYPDPRRFTVLNLQGLVKGNTWGVLAGLSDKPFTIGQFITRLMELGFNVVEFSDKKSFLDWLSEDTNIK